MKRISVRVLSFLLSLAIIAFMLPCISLVAVYASSEPVLLDEGLSGMVGSGSGRYVLTKDVQMETGAPVATAYKFECTNADGGATGTTLRNGTSSVYGISAKDNYVVISYYIKSELADGAADKSGNSASKPIVHTRLHYYGTPDGGTKDPAINEVNGNNECEMEPDVWYHYSGIFQATYQTSDSVGLRSEIGLGKYKGQTSYIGGYTAYEFSKDFAYGVKTGVDAIKAYLETNTLSDLKVNGSIIENFSADTYEYQISDYLNSVSATPANILAVVDYNNKASKSTITVKSHSNNDGKPCPVSDAKVQKYTVFSDRAITPSKEPELIQSGVNPLQTYGSTYRDPERSGIIDVNESGVPFSQAYRFVCIQNGGPTGGGIRTRNTEMFQAASGEYFLASYWIRGSEVDETDARVCLQYQKSVLNSNGIYDYSGGEMIAPVGQTAVQPIQVGNGEWYKRYEIFYVPNSTTKTDGDTMYALKFVVGASNVVGQVVDIGDYKLYSLGTEFTYGGKTGKEGIVAYLNAKDVTLSDISSSGTTIDGFDSQITRYNVMANILSDISATASSPFVELLYDRSQDGQLTINVLSYAYSDNVIAIGNPTESMTYTLTSDTPISNALSTYYDLGAWRMTGTSYYKGQPNTNYVSLNQEEGRIAAKFESNDAAYAEDDTASRYNGTLGHINLQDNGVWNQGDKFYISFWAKANSKYGNDCKLKISIEGATNTDGYVANATMASTQNFILTDDWKQYTAIVTLSQGLIDGAVNGRIQLALGYRGQTTYLSDFELHKCSSSMSNADILRYFEPEKINKINTGSTLSRVGMSAGENVAVKNISENELPFNEYYQFVCNGLDKDSPSGYRARLGANLIDQTNLCENDILMLTFWAKGEDSIAKMTPVLQTASASEIGGSALKTINRLVAGGETDNSVIEASAEWKRYAYLFSVPAMAADEVIRMEWQIGYVGQTINIADAQLFNLGATTTDEAFACLNQKDVRGVYYKTVKIEDESSTLILYRNSDSEYVTKDNISIDTLNGFEEAVVTKIPSNSEDTGTIVVYAPDGTINNISFKVKTAPKFGAERTVSYSSKPDVQVILKLDDLWSSPDENLECFARAVEMVKERGMKAALGVVGSYWENATEEQWNQLKTWSDDPDIEIWNHGWLHDQAEFSTASYDEQKEFFAKTMNLMAEHGINITAFGSPYNNSNVVTSRMIKNEFPQIEVTMLVQDNSVLFGAENITNLINRVYIETSVDNSSNLSGSVIFENFKANMEADNQNDYLVLQAHPHLWLKKGNVDHPEDTDYYFKQFEMCLDYLKAEGYQTTLPTEYARSQKNDTSIENLQAGTVTANLSIKNRESVDRDVRLIYAIYNKYGNLVDCNIRTVTFSALSTGNYSISAVVPDDGEPYTSKLFIWETEDITPIIEASIF